MAKLILDKGADIELRDFQGRTALYVPARAGNEAVLKLLLERGADIEAIDDRGRTPLLIAVHRPLAHEIEENLAAIKILLGHGADDEAEFRDDWRPLFVAVLYDSLHVAELLLGRRWDLNAEDNKGKTAVSDLRSTDMSGLLRECSKVTTICVSRQRQMPAYILLTLNIVDDRTTQAESLTVSVDGISDLANEFVLPLRHSSRGWAHIADCFGNLQMSLLTESSTPFRGR